MFNSDFMCKYCCLLNKTYSVFQWTVNGELRVGFFSKRPISAGEEITFDYQLQRYGQVLRLIKITSYTSWVIYLYGVLM